MTPRAGKKARLMEMCRKNAELFLGMLLLQREKRRSVAAPAVELLGRDLGMAGAPRRIECFDVSHMQGSDTVGSMVVFVDGKPRKSEYRKYNVASLDHPDDFAAMREIVGRRYERVISEGAEMPDLIVIDGGKGQLSSAVEALSRLGLQRIGEARGKDLRIIGLAKRLEEIHRPDADGPAVDPEEFTGTEAAAEDPQRSPQVRGDVSSRPPVRPHAANGARSHRGGRKEEGDQAARGVRIGPGCAVRDPGTDRRGRRGGHRRENSQLFQQGG